MEIDPSRLGRAKAGVKAALIARYRIANQVSRRQVVGDCPVDLSLTSYGERLEIVAYVIESLVAGSVRPRRLILWVDDPNFSTDRYPMLERLVARGLEIKQSENYGPHTKYYPYCAQTGDDLVPLVTADDDILYPRRWLETLWKAHQDTPEDFVGHRTVTVELDEEGLAPYATWRPTQSDKADYRTFVTGVGGVVYPAALIRELKTRGDSFKAIAPRADDVWINAIAVSIGVRARWTGEALWAWSFPRSQENALHHENTGAGGNDPQVALAYGESEIHRLRGEA